ncbi:MAG: DNA helicase RecQ [Patescibacteria group bacterium]|jgi:ATP-dependent DNA helicase RecQ
MKKLLKQYFGHDEFRPLQEEIINNVLAGSDSFVLMPTGGGKSLCFQLPALKLYGVTLVISPLIALMKDQVDSMRECGIGAEFINSSLTSDEINSVYRKIKQGSVKLLYIAPERFALSSFQEFLKSLEISLVAVDEAHCISEWGHDFRPDYRSLGALKKVFAGVPIIALTATATERVRADILKQLNLAKAKVFISSFNRENLKISVIEKKEAFPKLVKLLDQYKNESVIIYCFSRKETEDLVKNLKLNNFSARAYHAGLDNRERKITQDLFIKDKVDIIVATIAFGMGIDKSDVRLVVHYTFPKTLEGYYQEIGRAGRDGLPSECVMFYTYADTRKHQFFINQIEDNNLRRMAEEKLAEVLNYGDLDTCRKKYLLKYFGEELKNDNCGGCDVCLTPKEKFSAKIVAQKIISAILRTENRFGKNYIVDVLLGKATQKVKRNNHHELSVFGIVKDFSENGLAQIINQLVNQGYLLKNEGEYPTLRVARQGLIFLKNNEELELAKPRADMVTAKKVKQGEVDYNQELFDELRALRKEFANKADVPPFIIFGDASLQEMAYYFPLSEEEFLSISGVGAKKLEQYGEIFLARIGNFMKSHNISKAEVSVKDKTIREERIIKMLIGNPQFYAKTRELLIKKIPIERIAKHQDVKVPTVVNHIEKMIDAGERLDLEYLKLPLDSYNKIKESFVELGDEKLKPIFEKFNGEYSYDRIRLVRVLING